MKIKVWVPLGYHFLVWEHICGHHSINFISFLTNPEVHVGYQLYPNGTQTFCPDKYDVWAFQCRVARMFKTFCSICTIFWNMRISICLQKLLKIFKFSNILQIDLEVIRMRAIQELKAQNTYFSSRKNLGTIGVPFVPKKYNFDSNTKFTKIWPTQPTNGILQKIVVPKWYPKFYIQKVQGLSFSTPCQPSP